MKRWITLLDVIDHEDNGFLYLWQHRRWPDGRFGDRRQVKARQNIHSSTVSSLQQRFFRVITLIIRIDFHWELLSLDTQVGSFSWSLYLLGIHNYRLNVEFRTPWLTFPYVINLFSRINMFEIYQKYCFNYNNFILQRIFVGRPCL